MTHPLKLKITTGLSCKKVARMQSRYLQVLYLIAVSGASYFSALEVAISSFNSRCALKFTYSVEDTVIVPSEEVRDLGIVMQVL